MASEKRERVKFGHHDSGVSSSVDDSSSSSQSEATSPVSTTCASSVGAFTDPKQVDMKTADSNSNMSTDSSDTMTDSASLIARASNDNSSVTLSMQSSLSFDEADGHLPLNASEFAVTYLGNLVLDRRYTQPMLPWVMAEVRRRNDVLFVNLEICRNYLKARRMDNGELHFEHRLQSLSRFAKTHRDPKCFAYLTRPNSDSPFTCHVFEASSESDVPHLFKVIREATKVAVKDHHQHTGREGRQVENMGELMRAGYQFFEVLYTGRVRVSQKNAPPTFIDDTVNKFLEQQKLKAEEAATAVAKEAKLDDGRERHSSGNSVRSLPNSLENAVNVKENELKESEDKSSDGLNTSGELVESTSCSETTSSNEQLLDSSPRDNNDNTVVEKQPKQQQQQQRPARKLSNTKKPHRKLSNPHDNRTMLFQIGHEEISLISLDKKSIILDRNFKDISFCSQGVQHPEHFGFISREPSSSSFICYVFQCASDIVVEDVMQALKMAFDAAYNKFHTRNHIVCEMCPMHQLHKLCQDIDGIPPEKINETINMRIEQLNERDQLDVKAIIKADDPTTIRDRNEVQMKALRLVSEARQQEHIHINDPNRSQNRKNEFTLLDPLRVRPVSRLDTLKNKAKRSLANSFENLINRDSSAANTPDASPCQSPIKKEFDKNPFRSNDPINRRRSATVDGSTPAVSRKISAPARITDLWKEKFNELKAHADNPILRTHSPKSALFRNESDHNAGSPSPSHSSSSMTATPITPRGRRGSWRQQIFISVVTPVHSPKPPRIEEAVEPEDLLDYSKTGQKLSSAALRALWKKAILETVLLIRMEKENKSLQARQDEMEAKRQKLDYEEITPCLIEVTKVWDSLIATPNRADIKFDCVKLVDAVKAGVPRSRRGDIWQVLREQHEIHNPALKSAAPKTDCISYEDLLKQLTTHQHAILIDLGRTFPTHPYFSTQLGAGQLAMFNVLKAYSLLDKEVGYCQGLSFVAGVLLMHMPEEPAYETMKYMMYNLGLRRQYKPDMTALQIQLYQLSRLLHDMHREIYEHLEANEVAPTLYAAPWFLTVFASQFPLGFVSRVYDLILLQGWEVVFKVAVVLLGEHKELILQCDSFETVVEFLKTTLPALGIVQVERVINQVFTMDISKELQAYEVEYHVLQEEMISSPQRGDTDIIQKLETANRNLKHQNMELLEQLQHARVQQRSLEEGYTSIRGNEGKLKSHVRALELERSALLNAVSKLRELVPESELQAAGIQIPDVATILPSNESNSHENRSHRSNSASVVEVGNVGAAGARKASADSIIHAAKPKATNDLPRKFSADSVQMTANQKTSQLASGETPPVSPRRRNTILTLIDHQ
ncbi:TBC1 domain family member 1-like isoform X2 [Tubulanus polymorphus]|uniref:TBC1 domain family member 1-like isoform X2 n=1 Tax=Tubulanus polymorphus TaxID=672921 RepID=UPI003DA6CA21